MTGIVNPYQVGTPEGPTTWNQDDKAAGITLSGGNLVATYASGVGYQWARSTNARTSGKLYFEVTVTNMVFDNDTDYAAAGTALISSSLTNYLGIQADSSAYFGDGSVYAGNIQVASLAQYLDADIIACAIDLGGGKGWYSKNGVFASGDPAAGTGEHFTFTPSTQIFAGFTTSRVNDALTANFGATAFNTAPPTGFSAWDS